MLTTEEFLRAIAYANRRRAETKRAYIVTNATRALYDCPHNRGMVAELGETIVYRS